MANALTSDGIVTNGGSTCYTGGWTSCNVYSTIYSQSRANLPSSGRYTGFNVQASGQEELYAYIGLAGGRKPSNGWNKFLFWRVE